MMIKSIHYIFLIIIISSLFIRCNEITKGKTKIDELRPIPIEELLGREVIEAQSDLMKLAIKNKTILITGSGGSIGSELCRQILSMNPMKLILIDFCEYNLYKIYEELKELKSNQTYLEAKLINVENQFK